MIASLRRRAAPLGPLMMGLPEPNTWRYAARMGLQQQQLLRPSLVSFSQQNDQLQSQKPRSFVRPVPARALYTQQPLVPVHLAMSKSNGLSSNSLSLVRCYSGGPRRDWVDMAKTGALVVLGTGALVATVSVGFGFIITGAAAYGVYSLYQKFFGPYRSSPFGSSGSSGFNQISSIFGDRFEQRQPRSSRHADPNDLESLTQGLPFVVRELVKTIFSFVGSAMQSSMARAGELRRMTNEYVESHPRVIAALGSSARISTPQQWMESTLNGVGRIEAVFPIVDGYRNGPYVSVKASVGSGDKLNIQELKYRDPQTGEVIDLLRDGGSGGQRKTVIDAEYVEV